MLYLVHRTLERETLCLQYRLTYQVLLHIVLAPLFQSQLTSYYSAIVSQVSYQISLSDCPSNHFKDVGLSIADTGTIPLDMEGKI